jgi:DeoR-like helix-turn-helix domain
MTYSQSPIAAFISKKAFEISHALFILGESCGNPAFQSAVQNQGMDLLDAATYDDLDSMNAAIAALVGIRQFVSFGVVAGLVSREDSNLLNKECDGLNAAIQSAIVDSDKRQLPDSKLQNVFSSNSVPMFQARAAAKKTAPVIHIKEAAKEATVEEVIDMGAEDGPAEEEPEKVREGAPARQAKVIERIRQMGDCHMRDIQDYVPDVSERTLRNDLNELIAQGKIERIGAGGPSMFYRLKTVVVPSSLGPIQTA